MRPLPGRPALPSPPIPAARSAWPSHKAVHCGACSVAGSGGWARPQHHIPRLAGLVGFADPSDSAWPNGAAATGPVGAGSGWCRSRTGLSALYSLESLLRPQPGAALGPGRGLVGRGYRPPPSVGRMGGECGKPAHAGSAESSCQGLGHARRASGFGIPEGAAGASQVEPSSRVCLTLRSWEWLGVTD